MPSTTLPSRPKENRHIPDDAADFIHSLSSLVIRGNVPPGEEKPRRMITLEDDGVLKVFSEYENAFDEPAIRLKYFFTENATKVSVKVAFTGIDRVTQSHAALSSRYIEDIDIVEVSDLLRLELWGEEDEEEEDYEDEHYFNADD